MMSILVIAAALSATSGIQMSGGREYLSDIPDRLIHVEQGWGELGFDVCAHAADQTRLKLQIGEKSYRKGLGNHAPGNIVVDLEGRYLSFDAEVGVQRQPSPDGSVDFSVYVDGKKRFDSGVMHQDSPPRAIHLSLNGAQELRLVAGDGGDGIICDCADWADARLTLSPTAKPSPRVEFDIAPFAQVTTWDPARMNGARATRIEPFRADDVFLDQPVPSLPRGGYTLPANGCIGLLWLERRRPTKLALEFTGPVPDPEGVRVQAWTGMYPFQGTWAPLSGSIVRENRRLVFSIDPKANGDFGQGFRKVRWIVPPRGPFVVTRLTATYLTRMKTATLRLETAPGSKGTATLSPFGCTLEGLYKWDTSKPGALTVHYPVGGDGPTLPALRIASPHSAFSVNLVDALAGRGVLVRDAGVYIAKSGPGNTLADYKRSIQSKTTVLDRVRAMPDQTFEQAMRRTYRDIHLGGPTLLSLGADNRKWLVGADGTTVWQPSPEVAEKQLPFEDRRCLASVRFNNAPLHAVRNPTLPRGMKRWMPIVGLEGTEPGAMCRYTAFAAPYSGKALFVGNVELGSTKDASLDLTFQSDRNRRLAAQIVVDGKFVRVMDGDRLMAAVDLTGLRNYTASSNNGVLHLSGNMEGSLILAIPGWTVNPTGEELRDLHQNSLAAAFAAYWSRVAEVGMQIEIPDQLLSDIIQTSRIRCLIDSRNEAGGARFAPWIAEIHYGPLESEANTIIRGMALMGDAAFTERALDYFIHLYSPAGYLTTGYTLVGTGWHLWTLGEAFALQQDKAWLRGHADDIARVCRWVIAERHKTMKLDPLGNKPPQYGLMPPGVIADWNAYQYYFYSNGTYCAGLDAAGRALQAVGYPGANKFISEAAAFRKDILRAYRWAQARTPVVALQDGTWAPGQPSQVHCPGPLSGYYAGEDGSRSWCYDVEVGANNLVQQGVLPASGNDARDMADSLEDVMYLKDGWGDYPAAATEKDWFDLGGFAKVQPYYGRIEEIYAMRDDVKPFIRGYFNMIASLIDPANLTIWEHFDHMGAPDKTHETGVFLQQTRFMFVKERGTELWLAPFVTNNWMRNGMVVSAKNAPTLFGEVSYRIESHVDKGYIQAVVDPPKRSAPSAIVVRLRHPRGLRMKSVTVDGKRWPSFDAARDTVTLRGSGQHTVRAFYR